MIRGASIHRLYESDGPQAFVSRTRELLGLTRDRFGRPTVTEPQLQPEEFSLRDLAESIIGPDWHEVLGPARTNGFSQPLLEDASTGIPPSAFNNISAWNATVGGLIEVKILEAYRRPGFIADRLVRTIPTRQRSEKLPGIADIGDKAEEMKPGDPHPRAQFEERFVTTPETKKHGLAVDVTREAVHFDLTNQVLSRAERVGDWLGMRKEKRVLDVVLGITNTYSYRGTSYNTYRTSGEWINEHTTALVDWEDIDAALQFFSAMTDQETGERVLVNPNQLLVMPAQLMTARRIINATEIRTGDITTGTGTQTISANPVAGAFEILSSPIALQRLTDTDGGNVSEVDANKYWFLGDFQRAFAYMENWGMQVRRADPNDYTMLDHDLAFSVFANEMGTPAVLEPREVVRGVAS